MSDHIHSLEQPPYQAPTNVRNLALAFVGIGVLALGYGVATDAARGWSSGLIGAYYALSLAIGGAVIVSLMNVSKAGWGVVVRRVPEAMTGYMPVALVAMAAVCWFGMHHLYEWTDHSIVDHDPLTGKPQVIHPVAKNPTFDCGGGCALSTVPDYLRFAQMLLNGGTLDGKRYLSRTTVALMTSDHLGPKVATPVQPGELLMGVQGYTFGLGFMVRQGQGMASVPGSEGDYAWAGAGGTFFWIDPKEQVIGLLMAQTPGPQRQYYRRMVKQLVYQAIEN